MTVPASRAGPAAQPDPEGHDPREAVDDLFPRHALDLVRFALMLVGDQATAEDVVQVQTTDRDPPVTATAAGAAGEPVIRPRPTWR